ncbi:unnamed protein product [Oppiella nova]|uniref:Alpha-taxilin n=1 Tax=Oppiella nova TaxID=334625 RepID=A0A7R9LS27_9ACAR|nr:unnamed protein product [Oppiella nova]CAG2166417.1 unnamed protein product [Oppiella nova]
METPIGANGVDTASGGVDEDMDDLAADQLVKKLIERKDSQCDQLMSECSDRAKQIRDKINEMLDTRHAMVANAEDGVDGNRDNTSRIDTNSILKLQKELELEISGLNKTSKVCANEDNATNCLVLSNNKSINIPNDKSIKSDDSMDGNVGQSVDTNDVPAADIKSSPPPTTCTANESKANIKSSEKSSNVAKSEANVNNKSNANTASRKPVKNATKSRITPEQLTKKLSTFSTDAERISYLSQNLVEVCEENRSLCQQSKQNEKTTNQLTRERDQIQSEQNRLVLAKARLESLCRELQRQNRLIKDESLLKIKEEEEKRRDIANKFQSTLNEIMSLIGDNQKRNTQLKEENADLAHKLKTLMGHYETWETHTQKIIKQKDLETQLMKAKFTKTDLILNQEKQIFIKEKQQLIQMITDLQKRCADMSQSEVKLRTELGVYTNKYEEFQSVLSKSNEMFSGFKKDMERMSKQIKKLEKETILWKNRWETSNTALLKLSDEKEKRDTEHLKALQKIITLEKLCRAMQEERAILHERLLQADNELDDNSEPDGQTSNTEIALQPQTETDDTKPQVNETAE